MTWKVLGFEKDGEALTQKLNLDDALGRLLHLRPGERGPVYISHEAVATLGRIIVLPLEQARGRFIIEQEPPRGWVLKEIDDHGPVDTTDVDWELTRVFAELLGVDLEHMRGPGFGASYPLDRAKFARIAQLFALDADFDDAQWFLDEYANTPREN